MSWLDALLAAYGTIKDAGSAVIQRNALNFTGSGVTVTDDPVTKATTINVTSGALEGLTPSRVVVSDSGGVAVSGQAITAAATPSTLALRDGGGGIAITTLARTYESAPAITDARLYATGNGSTNDFAALQTAAAAAPRLHWSPGAYKTATTGAIGTSGVSTHTFERGAVIHAVVATPLTLRGQIGAEPDQQIFSVDAAGAIVLPDCTEIHAGWFGAVGDNATDNTIPLAAWLATLGVNNKGKIRVAGTYLTNAFTFPNNAEIEGVGDGLTIGGAVLKIQASASTGFTFGVATRLKNLTFHGGGFPTDAVCGFPNNVNSIVFEFCAFTGAIQDTSDLVAFTGTVGGDSCIFSRCKFMQDLSDASKHCRNAFRNDNGNAFFINVEDSFIFGAQRVAHLNGAGSINFLRCQAFDISSAFFRVESTCQTFTVDDFYTESSGVPFLQQVANAASTSPAEITLKRLELNAACNIAVNGMCPVTIENSYTIGSFDFTPDATYGKFSPLSISNKFTTGNGWTGTHVHEVVRIKDREGVDPVTFSGGVEINNIPGLSRLYVELPDSNATVGSITDQTASVIVGDDFHAGTLGGNRTLTLSTAAALVGQHMTFSVRSAGGTHTLAVGSLATLADKPGSPRWCEIEFNGSAWVLSEIGPITENGDFGAVNLVTTGTATAGEALVGSAVIGGGNVRLAAWNVGQVNTGGATVTPASPSVQALTVTGLRVATSSVMVTPQSNPGTNLVWSYRVSADDTLEVTFETTTVSVTLGVVTLNVYHFEWSAL